MAAAHFATEPGYGGKSKEHDPPLLYHLGHDPSEKIDVAKQHPEVIAEIRRLADTHQQQITPGEPQLHKRIGQK